MSQYKLKNTEYIKSKYMVTTRYVDVLGSGGTDHALASTPGERDSG
jgi:hypothetical protein